MELLIFTIFITLLTIVGFRAVTMYISYRKTIYKYLYPNYIEYFHKVFFLKDLSTSSFIKNCLGDHQITYYNLSSSGNQSLMQFITILTASKVFMLCVLPSIETNNKKINSKKHSSFDPAPYISKQEESIKKKLDKSEIHTLVVTQQEYEYKNLKLNFPIITYTDVIEELCKLENMTSNKEVQQLNKNY